MSTGLFQDEEDGYNLEETKYKLKLDNPSPAPADDSLDGLENLGGGDDLAGLEDLSGGASDKPFNDVPFDAGVEADEEEDPAKYIQQLAGKLGQSLRKYTEQQGNPDFDLEKFAVNSVLSATHTAEMDAEDQKDIINKVKSSGKGEGDIDVNVDVDTDADNQDVSVNGDEQNSDVNLGDEADVTEESFDSAIQSLGISKHNPNDFNADDMRRYYDSTVTRKRDGLTGRVLRWDNGKLKIKITDGPHSGKIFFADPSEVDMDSENFNIGEGKTPVDVLSNLTKKPNFVDKTIIINKLNETFMTETEPAIKPAPTTVPDTKPDVRPTRRQKPWRPTIQPKVNPKAGGKEIMSEDEGGEGRIISTKFLDNDHAILVVMLGGEEVDMKFENTDEVLVKPEAYDEPWVYDYKSVKSPDGKEYSIGVEFFGHPETHLEIAGIDGEYIQ